ncbi:hypothetical protein O7605_20665 [Verrucosispora sp. WMMA2121]|uniref:RNA polymerase sigma factor n=1 Tax=Verrucosispora sp. WMMA2121 TaxID=3015164 RepID=UPI0022B73156|nr:hypothetical protein [Verrucosispora sp. WMMA2121]MCZ7421916.1 hypothetical protein [Verrucosispora sp. WMMA2121]
MGDRDGGTWDGVEDLLDLMREHFLVGLVRQMRQVYPEARTVQLEDAVATAVEKLYVQLRKGAAVADPRSYLAKIAHNEFKRGAQRSIRREVLHEQCPEHLDDSAESEALRDAAVSAIKAEVRSWENANIREVMLVYVESIAYGEPVEAEEVAAIVSQTLGEDISASSVRVWKMRGLKKLRDFVENAGLVDTGRTYGGGNLS